MNKIHLLLVLIFMVSCQPTEDEKAAPLMHRIDSLFQKRDYRQTLTAIKELRVKHPAAVESRRKALKIWQEASLLMTQEDIGTTDSALQVTIEAYKRATTFGEKNRLRVRRDSLQVRYDALCGTVRVIHKRQKER
ncbi:MAG: hypothetical protein I3J02_01590 [Prevotella sp.]|nr:hypothetical protein [Prevotella sp.]